jgi:hypothetical protein
MFHAKIKSRKNECHETRFSKILFCYISSTVRLFTTHSGTNTYSFTAEVFPGVICFTEQQVPHSILDPLKNSILESPKLTLSHELLLHGCRSILLTRPM